LTVNILKLESEKNFLWSIKLLLWKVRKVLKKGEIKIWKRWV